MNLTYASDTSAVLRVDTDTGNQTSGRKSVRITSTDTYDSGLFIFDVVHTPYGCATWPALWLTDPSNWPENGEIDVMESNNNATHGNAMTLHTTSGCKMNVKRKEAGTSQGSNCLNTANNNAGCGVEGKKATYGEVFNNNGGGVRPGPIFSFLFNLANQYLPRCTRWSYVTPASAFGCSHAMISHPIYLTPVAQILLHGVRLWRTSLAQIVTSARTSGIRALLQTLISVVISRVLASTIQIFTTAPRPAHSGLQRMGQASRMLTGSSTVLRSIRRHRPGLYSLTIILCTASVGRDIAEFFDTITFQKMHCIFINIHSDIRRLCGILNTKKVYFLIFKSVCASWFPNKFSSVWMRGTIHPGMTSFVCRVE